MNVNSLLNKVDHMTIFVKVPELNIISISETWLASGVESSFVAIYGYVLW